MLIINCFNIAHSFRVNIFPKNELSTRQWEILKDPDRHLLGGFISRWKNEDKLGKTFIDNAKKGLIMQAFDQIIGLESGKIKRKNANIVG